MKILLLSHTGAVTGGAEQCLLEYVDVLIAKGHKCKVMVPRKGDMTRTLTERKIDCTIVGYGWATRPHRKVNAHKIMASTGNSLVRIFQEVEKFKPDLIITNTSVLPWGLYAGRTFNIPTMMLVHEILSDKDPSLNMVPSYEAYADILNRNVDYVIYNSEFVKNEFAALLQLPKTSETILYPLPALDKAKIDHYYRKNTVKGKLKIGVYGALSPRKNQMEVLQAAKVLRDRGLTDFIIDLYGDKTANIPYTKQLRRFITQNSLTANVKIRGFSTNVYEKMNEHNVVVSTATYEPFGRTIIEGQLFARIAISNNTGGGPELVEDMVTGLVYDLSNPAQLADKIAWIMNNPKAAVEMGLNAKHNQFQKYVTSMRYQALVDAVDYFADRTTRPVHQNIYDPLNALFQYNHQLNNKYRHIYRLSHNRATYAVKGRLDRGREAAKTVVKHLLP